MMNNVATAAVMCPIAISTASQLGVSADAFSDANRPSEQHAYPRPRRVSLWRLRRLGLALEIIVLVVSVPMLLWVWPL